MRALIGGPTNSQRTIEGMIRAYLGRTAPQHEIDLYLRNVRDFSRLSLDAMIGGLSPEQFNELIKAMQRHEGFWSPNPDVQRDRIEGTIERQDAPAQPERRGNLLNTPVEQLAEDDIDQIIDSAPYWDAKHPDHGRTQATVRAWFERRHGGGPVQVSAHSREGGKIDVDAHTRSAPSR